MILLATAPSPQPAKAPAMALLIAVLKANWGPPFVPSATTTAVCTCLNVLAVAVAMAVPDPWLPPKVAKLELWFESWERKLVRDELGPTFITRPTPTTRSPLEPWFGSSSIGISSPETGSKYWGLKDAGVPEEALVSEYTSVSPALKLKLTLEFPVSADSESKLTESVDGSSSVCSLSLFRLLSALVTWKFHVLLSRERKIPSIPR